MSGSRRQSVLSFVRFVAFAIISALLMIADQRNQQVSELRGPIASLLYPLQTAIAQPTQWADNWRMRMQVKQALLLEIEQLQQQQLVAAEQLQLLEYVQLENHELRRTLEAREAVPNKSIMAELQSVARDPDHQLVTLDRGADHGVYKGQPFIDSYGIMGQIRDVASDHATGLLLTDPSNSVPVIVIRNGLRTVASGTGASRRIELNFVPDNADIQVGDRLVTSGIAQRYPEGYPVGIVTDVTRVPGQQFAQVLAQPYAKVLSSTRVLLLKAQQYKAKTMDEAVRDARR